MEIPSLRSHHQTRLFVILARNAPRGVIFRRGPSKQTHLIKWNTENDTFEHGQWFKGRIYERRCDLSPDGKKLIYFAAKYKGPFQTWTAISKIPYFSALALWPKGDAWGGGGLFDNSFSISLNHSFNSSHSGFKQMRLAPGFHLPEKVVVHPLGEHSGHGEDHPIYHLRLIRDGWIQTQEGTPHEKEYTPSEKIWIIFDPPIEYVKKIKINNGDREFQLHMQIVGFHEWGGSQYVIEYKILDLSNNAFFDLHRLDWADWDRNGDLLFSKEGKLFRLKPDLKSPIAYDPQNSLELADFTQCTFEEKRPPAETLEW